MQRRYIRENIEHRKFIVNRTGMTQLDLSGNLLVGLPPALASLSNLIHLRKGGGRRNDVFSKFKKTFLANFKKNCSHEVSVL
jgi:Leucine-rich repeat (LRR) protein